MQSDFFRRALWDIDLCGKSDEGFNFHPSVTRLQVLRSKMARFLKEDLLRSKILSDYWCALYACRGYPNIANIAQ